MRTTTFWIGPLLALCLVAAATPAAENGAKGQPLKGEIASTTATGLVITVGGTDGAAGAQQTVDLAAGAEIRSGKDTIALGDLPVGGMVAVTLDAEGKASSVRLLKAKKPKADKPKGDKPKGEQAKPKPEEDLGEDDLGHELDDGGFDGDDAGME